MEPQSRIVYIFMDAKNMVQPAVPIQPDFAQVAWTVLDPQGQSSSKGAFAIKTLLTISKMIIL